MDRPILNGILERIRRGESRGIAVYRLARTLIKETAYVEATRARRRTDWYIAHQDLNPNTEPWAAWVPEAQRAGRPLPRPHASGR
jgi:hypothetical protein